jgi:uncharacterized membrane protein YkoI
MLRIVPLLAIAVLLLGTSFGIRADDVGPEEARRAVARGELRPLSEILADARKEFGGKVIEVELARKRSGRYIYEIEILTDQGRVIEVEYDGRTGQRLSVEEEDDDDDDDD